MGGQSGDPWALWEFCDCNRFCPPYGGCARAYLLTLWVPRKSRHQRVIPSAHSTAPKPSLFIDSKTTGARKPLLDKIVEVPSWLLRSEVLDMSTSWEGGDRACSGSFLRNVHANQKGISHTLVFNLI